MQATPKCPKCGFLDKAPFAECPRCGIIVRKFLERKQSQRQTEAVAARTENADSQRFADAEALMVRQKKEWGEILTGFETRNKYVVMDVANNLLFNVEEDGGAIMKILTRILLKALRPFTMDLFAAGGALVYQLNRPFRFYFHEICIRDAGGTQLGSVKRRFSILRRNYSVYDANGHEIYDLFGPLLHPWTFQIRTGEQEVGKITKKWSGLAKEFFTDADNFGVVFPQGIDLPRKAVLLGAVFLIDAVHFENSGNS